MSLGVRRARREAQEGACGRRGFSELGRGQAQQAHATHLVVHVKPLGVVVQFLGLQGYSCHEAKSLLSEVRPGLVLDTAGTFLWPV